MNAIQEKADALEAALRAVEGVRFYSFFGPKPDPGKEGAVVLALPRLTWDTYSDEPTGATFLVAVVVAVDERAGSRLWELTPRVVAAIEAVPGCAVREPVDPGEWVGLPSYQILVEVVF